MAQESRSKLKTYFQTGKAPTEQNYVNLIDSFSTIGSDQNSGSLTLTGSLDITGSQTITGSIGVSGNISATGNISSSANIYGTNAYMSGSLYIEDLYFYHTGSTSYRFIVPGYHTDNSLADNLYIGNQYKNILFNTKNTKFNIGDVFINKQLEVTYSSSFGTSIQHTHKFTGHITSSHNISSSGTITAEHVLSSDDIVAQGDISSSGTIFADNFTSTGGDVGGISFTDGVNITGSITASGNISSSGTITAEHLTISDDVSITDDLTVSGDVTANSGTGSFEYLTSTNFIGSRPIKTRTSNTTLALADIGTYNRCGSHIITIPLNSSVAFATGTEIEFIQTSSAGHLFLNSGSNSVTLNSRHDIFSASGQFSAISIKKVGSDEWDVIGDLTA